MFNQSSKKIKKVRLSIFTYAMVSIFALLLIGNAYGNNDVDLPNIECNKGFLTTVDAIVDAKKENTVPLIFRPYENIDGAAVSISNYAQRRNPDLTITCHIDTQDQGQKTAMLSLINRDAVPVETRFNLASSIPVTRLIEEVKASPDDNHLLSAIKLAHLQNMILEEN